MSQAERWVFGVIEGGGSGWAGVRIVEPPGYGIVRAIVVRSRPGSLVTRCNELFLVHTLDGEPLADIIGPMWPVAKRPSREFGVLKTSAITMTPDAEVADLAGTIDKPSSFSRGLGAVGDFVATGPFRVVVAVSIGRLYDPFSTGG